mgnify:FL=1
MIDQKPIEKASSHPCYIRFWITFEDTSRIEIIGTLRYYPYREGEENYKIEKYLYSFVVFHCLWFRKISL